MFRPTIRRVIWLLFGCAWFAGVHWHWKNVLPLQPMGIVHFEDGWSPITAAVRHPTETSECLTLLANGNLVLARRHVREDIAGGGSFYSHGPIRVWDPVRRQVVHEVADFQDRIDQAFIGRRGVAVIFSEGFVTLVNLLEGKIVLRKYGVNSDGMKLSQDGRLVLLSDGERNRWMVFDCETGQSVFELPHAYDKLEFLGGEIAIVTSAENGNPTFFNTRTWQPLPERQIERGIHQYSPDGRWAIRWTPGGDVLMNCISQQEVVQLSFGSEKLHSQWDFRSGGAELIQIALPAWSGFYSGPPLAIDFIGDNRILVVRRSTADGRVLSRAIVESGQVLPVSRSAPDGRLFVGSHETHPNPWLSRMGQVFGVLGVNWTPMPIKRFVAIDTATGKFLTNIASIAREYVNPRNWEGDPKAEFSQASLAVVADEQIRVFAFPLQRRWLWLFGWGAGPPGLVILIVRLLPRRRQRATTRVAAAPSKDRVQSMPAALAP